MGKLNKLEYKRFQYKMGRIQYMRDLIGDGVYQTKSSINQINKVSQLEPVIKQPDTVNDEFDIIHSENENVESTVLEPTDLSLNGTELVPYESTSGLQSGDEYWEEKKGLFGKTKMVKRSVK